MAMEDTSVSSENKTVEIRSPARKGILKKTDTPILIDEAALSRILEQDGTSEGESDKGSRWMMSLENENEQCTGSPHSRNENSVAIDMELCSCCSRSKGSEEDTCPELEQCYSLTNFLLLLSTAVFYAVFEDLCKDGRPFGMAQGYLLLVTTVTGLADILATFPILGTLFLLKLLTFVSSLGLLCLWRSWISLAALRLVFFVSVLLCRLPVIPGGTRDGSWRSHVLCISLDAFFFCCNFNFMAYMHREDLLLFPAGLFAFQASILPCLCVVLYCRKSLGMRRLLDLIPRLTLLVQAAFLIYIASTRTLYSEAALAEAMYLALYFFLKSFSPSSLENWKKMAKEALFLTASVFVLLPTFSLMECGLETLDPHSRG
jgi:hypothetical protein